MHTTSSPNFLHQCFSAMARPSDCTETCCICGAGLNAEEGDDFEKRLCGDCELRPDAARRVKASSAGRASTKVVNGFPENRNAGRSFTAADKSLISKLHGHMPTRRLLDVLNDRLVCDIGDGALLYTMNQLHAEIAAFTAANPASGAAPAGGHDWASLRKIMSKAVRDGVLEQISEQVINDFAVVYSLNPKQVIVLKDIVLQAKKDMS